SVIDAIPGLDASAAEAHSVPSCNMMRRRPSFVTGPATCANFGANGWPSMAPVLAGAGCAGAAALDVSGEAVAGAEDDGAGDDAAVAGADAAADGCSLPGDPAAEPCSSEAVSLGSVAAGFGAPPQATRTTREQPRTTRIGDSFFGRQTGTTAHGLQ